MPAHAVELRNNEPTYMIFKKAQIWDTLYEEYGTQHATREGNFPLNVYVFRSSSGAPSGFRRHQKQIGSWTASASPPAGKFKYHLCSISVQGDGGV